MRSLRDESDPWGALLAAELPELSVAPTDHLVHDLLNEDWEPVWFADFAGAAQRNGLQYVGEASFHRVTGPWEPEVEAELWRLAEGDRIAYQQFVDFMVWRRFRDSLLCHAGRDVSDHIDHSRMRALRFRAERSARRARRADRARSFQRSPRTLRSPSRSSSYERSWAPIRSVSPRRCSTLRDTAA